MCEQYHLLNGRRSPGRSGRSPGTRSCGCARYRKLARGKPANVASRPRSLVSWRASSGPSRGACRRRRADRKRPVIASQGGASEPPNSCCWATRKRGCGQENPRNHYLPRRGSDAGHETEAAPRRVNGQAVSTRASDMINRRLDDRASCPPGRSLKQMPPAEAPESCNSGQGSERYYRFPQGQLCAIVQACKRMLRGRGMESGWRRLPRLARR
jgi:hypothetical protein